MREDSYTRLLVMDFHNSAPPSDHTTQTKVKTDNVASGDVHNERTLRVFSAIHKFER